MKLVYVPILKAKPGELTALAELKKFAAEKVIPWFDISPVNDDKLVVVN